MKTLAITSGKGGTGKTCIAANLGVALRSEGHRVVIFDADLQLANLDVALGVRPEYTIQHVVNEEKTLREVLCPGPQGIRVACGGSAIPSLMSAGPKRMATFLGQIDELASDTDFLIFDTGGGLDNRVMTFLRVARRALVVTTPDPTSVTDAYALVKVASKKAPTTEVCLFVNMVSNVAEAEAVHAALDRTAKAHLGLGIPVLGYMHADHEVTVATRQRRPFFEAGAKLRPSREVAALAASIAHELREPMLRAA